MVIIHNVNILKESQQVMLNYTQRMLATKGKKKSSRQLKNTTVRSTNYELMARLQNLETILISQS